MEFHILMQQFMPREEIGETAQLLMRRQVAVDDQVGRFDECRL